MRYVKLIIPALIIVAAGFGMWWFDDIWERVLASLPVSLLFVRRFGIRYGARRIFLFLLMFSLPVVLRQKVRHRIGQWRELVGTLKKLWQSFPRWLQVSLAFPVFVLAIVAIVTTGGFVRFLALPPLQYAANVLFGEWFKTVIIPVLLRFAAARGIERVFPVVVGLFPVAMRRFVRRWYTWLVFEALRRFSLSRNAVFERRPHEAPRIVPEPRITYV